MSEVKKHGPAMAGGTNLADRHSSGDAQSSGSGRNKPPISHQDSGQRKILNIQVLSLSINTITLYQQTHTQSHRTGTAAAGQGGAPAPRPTGGAAHRRMNDNDK